MFPHPVTKAYYIIELYLLLLDVVSTITRRSICYTPIGDTAMTHNKPSYDPWQILRRPIETPPLKGARKRILFVESFAYDDTGTPFIMSETKDIIVACRGVIIYHS